MARKDFLELCFTSDLTNIQKYTKIIQIYKYTNIQKVLRFDRNMGFLLAESIILACFCLFCEKVACRAENLVNLESL